LTKFADLPEKTLLRPDEVALFFRVDVRTVRRWIELGRLTVKQLGKKNTRIYRDSVIRLARADNDQ
jgi:excisionase family DNA binding protein